MPLKLHNSNKNGLILEHDDQLFYNRGKGVNKVLWRCIHYSKGCRGICHTTDATEGAIFQRTSVSRGQLRIQGVATCLYLCMDSCGLLFGSREYTEDCVFNETLEQHNYNTYSSVRWSTPRKTLYLGLNRHGQSRRVQARGHNLGRLSAYARVLTQVAPPDRVEALQNRMLGAQHGIRHHHNVHHRGQSQHAACPTLPLQEKDGRDRFRCRKRKKRKKKKKRRCKEDEQPGPHCEVYQRDSEHRVNEKVTGEGPLASKRSCEDAASEEFCRRQALDAPSKKRKSRKEDNNDKEENYHPSRKDAKKKNGKKSTPSADASKDTKKSTVIGAKRREQVPQRSSQGKKKIPNRSTKTTLPVLLNRDESMNSWQTTPATVMVLKHQKLSTSSKNAVTGSVKIEMSRIGKELSSVQEESLDLATMTSVTDSQEDDDPSSSLFQVSEEPFVSSFTDDSSAEINGEDLEDDDEQTTLSIDYSTVMNTMDTTPPERTADYTKATTPIVIESLVGSRKLGDDVDVSGILEGFSIGRLAM